MLSFWIFLQSIFAKKELLRDINELLNATSTRILFMSNISICCQFQKVHVAACKLDKQVYICSCSVCWEIKENRECKNTWNSTVRTFLNKFWFGHLSAVPLGSINSCLHQNKVMRHQVWPSDKFTFMNSKWVLYTKQTEDLQINSWKSSLPFFYSGNTKWILISPKCRIKSHNKSINSPWSQEDYMAHRTQEWV